MATCILTLAVNPSGAGTATFVSGSSSGNCGRTVTIKATPVGQYLFVSWSNGITSNPYTLQVKKTSTLTAKFASYCTLSLVVDPPSSGMISFLSGSSTGTIGRTVVVQAQPFLGYYFQSWSNGSANNPLTYIVNQNSQLIASMQQNCYVTPVSIPASGGYIALISGSSPGICGRQIKLFAIPATGSIFLGWNLVSGSGSTNNPETFTNNSINQIICAYFSG